MTIEPHDRVMLRPGSRYTDQGIGVVEAKAYTTNGEATVRVKWSEDRLFLYDASDLIKIDLPEDRSPAAVERWLASDEAAGP